MKIRKSLIDSFSFSALLIAVTLFGFQMAQWTRWDRLPTELVKSWPFRSAVHVSVLAAWTFFWLLFWKRALERRGGVLLAIGVALLAALSAEVIQTVLPGHACDWGGLCNNLLGVIATLLFCRRLILL